MLASLLAYTLTLKVPIKRKTVTKVVVPLIQTPPRYFLTQIYANLLPIFCLYSSLRSLQIKKAVTTAFGGCVYSNKRRRRLCLALLPKAAIATQPPSAVVQNAIAARGSSFIQAPQALVLLRL